MRDRSREREPDQGERGGERNQNDPASHVPFSLWARTNRPLDAQAQDGRFNELKEQARYSCCSSRSARPSCARAEMPSLR